MKKAVTLLAGITILLGLTSCGTWKSTDFQKLENKKFVFAQFNYMNKGKEDDYAFNFMQSFKTKEMLKLISDAYGLEIDDSQFTAFLEKGDIKPIKSMGWGPLNSYFVWEIDKIKNQKNRIEFNYYYKEDIEYDSIERDFRLDIFINGVRQVAFIDAVDSPDQVLVKIKEAIDKREKK